MQPSDRRAALRGSPGRAASASTGGSRHTTSGVGTGASAIASSSVSVRARSASIFENMSPTRNVARSLLARTISTCVTPDILAVVEHRAHRGPSRPAGPDLRGARVIEDELGVAGRETQAQRTSRQLGRVEVGERFFDREAGVPAGDRSRAGRRWGPETPHVTAAGMFGFRSSLVCGFDWVSIHPGSSRRGLR